MKISVIGTGAVGRRLSAALERAGHEVLLGSRDPAQALARTETSATGAPPIGTWHEDHPASRWFRWQKRVTTRRSS